MLPICSVPGADVRRIGWGEFGPQFDVPISEFEILGGEPDMDYLRYVVKRKTSDEYFELWFGPYAFNPDPDKELLEDSVSKKQRRIVNADAKEIGKDSSGKLQTGQVWRHFFLAIRGLEGARYKSSAESAALFDRIIDSACYVQSGM